MLAWRLSLCSSPSFLTVSHACNKDVCRRYLEESGPTLSPHSPSQALWKFALFLFCGWHVPPPHSCAHACYLSLVPQSSAIFLLPESGIFLFVTIWWFFKHYDWHFAIWADLILCIVFLSTFLICPFIHSVIVHPSVILISAISWSPYITERKYNLN